MKVKTRSNGEEPIYGTDIPMITCKGFKASGIAAGIKKNGARDLGLIYSEIPAAAAGLFTMNRVKAAPVLLDMERVRSGQARAVIVNSGNANCCTGPQGWADVRSMTRRTAESLGIVPEQTLAASTGVIGEPMPMGKIDAAIPELVRALNPTGFGDFAEAIMTTDTVPKVISRQANLAGESFTIVATAKGAGMIRPDMATMLCFICTDAVVTPDILKASVLRATHRSFNRITIDGDTSTNDTVLILANGASGVSINGDDARSCFQELLDEMLLSLARKLVKDGEGVTKLVEVKVRGAATEHDAETIVDAVCHSPLVKTAFFGQDANWGRILGAAGRSGAALDPDRIDLYFDSVQMVKNGVGCGKAVEARATEVLQQDEFTVTIDLNLGGGTASMLTCDFSLDYVKINADYRT